MEYLVAIIIGALAVLFVVGGLFLWGRREGSTESFVEARGEAVKKCYNLCRDDPKQTFYSCATMCSNTVG